MEDFANKMTVVRIEDFSEMDDAHYLALINIALSEEKTLQIMTVYDRMVEESYYSFLFMFTVREENEQDDEEKEDENEESVITRVHYQMMVGTMGEKLGLLLYYG